MLPADSSRLGLRFLLIPTPLLHPTVAPVRQNGYLPVARLPSPGGKGRLARRSPRVAGAYRRDSGSDGRSTATSPSSVMSTAGASKGKKRIVLGVFDMADTLPSRGRGRRSHQSCNAGMAHRLDVPVRPARSNLRYGKRTLSVMSAVEVTKLRISRRATESVAASMAPLSRISEMRCWMRVAV